MSSSTTKLGLIKPAPGEKFNRATYNANLDLIDADAVDRSKIRHFEAYVASQNTPSPASTWWGPQTPITAARDSTASFNDAEFTEAVSAAVGTDGLRLTKEGIYTITWGIGNAGSSSNPLWHIICANGADPTQANGSVLGRSPTFAIPVGDWYYAFAENFYVPPAGKNIFFKFSSGLANSPIVHRIRVTKIS